jgi:hypothetical protein
VIDLIQFYYFPDIDHYLHLMPHLISGNGWAGHVFRAVKNEWAFAYIPRSKRSGRKHLSMAIVNTCYIPPVYVGWGKSVPVRMGKFIPVMTSTPVLLHPGMNDPFNVPTGGFTYAGIVIT